MAGKTCKPVFTNQSLQGRAPTCGGWIALVESAQEPTRSQALKEGVKEVVAAVVADFRLTNGHLAGRAAKVGAGLLVGGAVASELGALTPMKWGLSRFGSLPVEFTTSGSIQVFRLSWGARLGHVALAATAKFALVAVVFQGGILIGSVVNQALSDDSKNVIGGIVSELVNEEGWALLWAHPFGIGM